MGLRHPGRPAVHSVCRSHPCLPSHQLTTACLGVHRSLGVHISRVKSLKLDNWTDTERQAMHTNAPAAKTERCAADTALPGLTSFIQAKYTSASIQAKYTSASSSQLPAAPAEQSAEQPAEQPAASEAGMRNYQGILMIIKPSASFVKPKLRKAAGESIELVPPKNLKARSVTQ